MNVSKTLKVPQYWERIHQVDNSPDFKTFWSQYESHQGECLRSNRVIIIYLLLCQSFYRQKSDSWTSGQSKSCWHVVGMFRPSIQGQEDELMNDRMNEWPVPPEPGDRAVPRRLSSTGTVSVWAAWTLYQTTIFHPLRPLVTWPMFPPDAEWIVDTYLRHAWSVPKRFAGDSFHPGVKDLQKHLSAMSTNLSHSDGAQLCSLSASDCCRLFTGALVATPVKLWAEVQVWLRTRRKLEEGTWSITFSLETPAFKGEGGCWLFSAMLCYAMLECYTTTQGASSVDFISHLWMKCLFPFSKIAESSVFVWLY